MPNPPTALSDCISRCVAHDTLENYEEFLRVFLGSQLGLILLGISQDMSGQYVAGKDELKAAMANTPDGKKMILTCADRAVFVLRFNRQFNAEIGAPALINMAIGNPDCEGIMVNSATSEHRLVIPRSRLVELNGRIGPNRPN